MLKLSVDPALDELREAFRFWLASNPPPVSENQKDSSLDTFVNVGRAWQEKLSEGGWVGVHWPVEYGGKGLPLVAEAVIQEELVRLQSPQLLGLFGLTMVGPVLIRYGTPEQKKRFLSNILSAKEIWCQGFSEPGAGSDLAAITTKAARTENDKKEKGFVINGSKIWTSFAHIADWCFVLSKSLDGPKKYDNFTYLLVNMKTPGITVRPLAQITGDSEFNEVFFDNVFVPEENLVGAEGEGWKIAISTLMYERVVLTFARQLQSEVLLRNMLSKNLVEMSEVDKKDLAAEVANFCAVRALAYDHLTSYLKGTTPGPEGSLDKLFWTNSYQSLTKLALRISPNKIYSESESDDVHRYLYSRGRSIAAGTSEIQRNIIAERLLDLPRLKQVEMK